MAGRRSLREFHAPVRTVRQAQGCGAPTSFSPIIRIPDTTLRKRKFLQRSCYSSLNWKRGGKPRFKALSNKNSRVPLSMIGQFKKAVRGIQKSLQLMRMWPAPQRISTSVSDNQAFPNFCLQACSDYRRFNYFRRNPIYNQILEHVSESQGAEYLKLISQDADVLKAIDKFRENDDWGNPRTFKYPGVGVFSPTTLRYIKVLVDL